ncbi:MAG: queuosine precursor transporter [Acidobacteriota bacterium]
MNKHLDTITGLFVAVLLISNIASTKIVSFLWFTFDGGTILFPLSYIFGDILTEVYGYRESRKVIWIGFISAFLLSVTLIIVGALPSAPDWTYQDAYEKILGLTPRLVLASLLAFWSGEFSNSFVLAKMKVRTRGKFLWTRTIGSTVVGEFIDTAIFVLVAFAGIMPGDVLVSIIVSNYVFKTGVEVLFTPLTYRVVGWLKKEEGRDTFDVGTNFNPFRFTPDIREE